MNRQIRMGFSSTCCVVLPLVFTALVCFAAHAERTATATATVTNGFVVDYTVTDGGLGYTASPLVIVAGGGGTGASAEAFVAAGAVTRIRPVAAGSGYTSVPDVIVAAPETVPPLPPVLAMEMIPLVTLYGFPGDTNQIEVASSLEPRAVWIPLVTVVMTNSVLEWYDRISPPRSRGFYRAVLQGTGSLPTPGPRFVWLPAGQFTMGSPSGEQDRQIDESPKTVVTFTSGFFLSRYEVTQAEYLSVMGTNPSQFLGDTNRPVERVSWYDATNYCIQRTAQERTAGRLPMGWAYRLPTEAEWEYASRAGSTNRFSYGQDPGYARLTNFAWYDMNSGMTSHTVGVKTPNHWGLYDMSGNVWEWCWDFYAESLPGGSVIDPQGPITGGNHVFRGSSWGASADLCRSAARYKEAYPGYKGAAVGFRVVLAPSRS